MHSEIHVNTFLSLFQENDTYSTRIIKVLHKAVHEKRDAKLKKI